MPVLDQLRITKKVMHVLKDSYGSLKIVHGHIKKYLYHSIVFCFPKVFLNLQSLYEFVLIAS